MMEEYTKNSRRYWIIHTEDDWFAMLAPEAVAEKFRRSKGETATKRLATLQEIKNKDLDWHVQE